MARIVKGVDWSQAAVADDGLRAVQDAASTWGSMRSERTFPDVDWQQAVVQTQGFYLDNPALSKDRAEAAGPRLDGGGGVFVPCTREGFRLYDGPHPGVSTRGTSYTTSIYRVCYREDDADARVFAADDDGTVWDTISLRGDFDGDGTRDMSFAVSSDSTLDHYAGSVLFFSGPFVGDRNAEDADLSVHGSVRYQMLGMASNFCGDQNDDSRDDAVVGSTPDGVHEREAYLLLTPFSGSRVMPDDQGSVLVGRTQMDAFGGAMEYLDDLDGDGTGDIAITSWGADSNGLNSGSVFLFFGPLGNGVQDAAAAASLELRGEAGSGFGEVVGSGDVDADGKTDLLVGAPFEGTAGAVHVYTAIELLTMAGL